VEGFRSVGLSGGFPALRCRSGELRIRLLEIQQRRGASLSPSLGPGDTTLFRYLGCNDRGGDPIIGYGIRSKGFLVQAVQIGRFGQGEVS